ncbi:MAG: hypothetical protein EA390_10330, partial [Balneolaceae bacterium]
MPDPIHVEKTFQELLRELEDASSIRYKFTLVREFITYLESRYEVYESYLIQLAEYLPRYSTPLTYSGIDPEEIDSLIALFKEVSASVPEWRRMEHVHEVKSSLYRALFILYVCLNENEKQSAVLREWLGVELAGSDQEKERKSNHPAVHALHSVESVIQSLKTLLGGEQNISASNQTECEELLKHLIQLTDHERGVLLIPVVEDFKTIKKKRSETGRLRKMRMRIHGESDEENDRIVRRFQIYGEEQPYTLDEENITKTVRKLFAEHSNRSVTQYFKGDIEYEMSGSYHYGNSFIAATAALWYTGIQHHLYLRDRFEVYSWVSITGNIDGEGKLQSVDVTGIPRKTRAAFFSWCPYLIVPKEQEHRFREEMLILNEKYPDRELKIIGIEHLNELFFDRRLTKHFNPPKLNYAVKLAWKKKFETVGIIAICIMAVVIFRLIYGPLDKNPVMNTFTGEVLQIKNQAGSVLETLWVGSLTVSRANFPDAREYVTFADVTSDGRNEIFWAEVEEREAGDRRGYLHAKNVNSSEKKWSREISYDLNFVNKPFVTSNRYSPMKMRVGDFNRTGQQQLLASINHINFFPGILSLKDPSTGEEFTHFVNTGHIRDFTVFDLNGDGTENIIFCGINNAFNTAFLGVLDFDQLAGHSPLTEEYKLEGKDIASHMDYVLIPPTIMARSILRHRSYNNATRVEVLENEQLIRVSVFDFEQYPDSDLELPSSRAYLDYYFDFNLSLRSIGSSDGYDTSAAILLENGIID